MIKKRIIVIGGGTMQPIRNHLSLCAPAFGTTAKYLSSVMDAELVLTKMADAESTLLTNEDVESYVDKLILDETVGVIVLNVAFCDFKAKDMDGIKNGFHSKRLKTADGNITIELEPTEKIIGKIRKARPDIFLVGFKTTTDADSETQFLTALKMMKSTKCNLVLANDTVTRNNIIITPEESTYANTTDRKSALDELADIISLRSDLTYDRSMFSESENVSMEHAPKLFKKVVQYLIDNGGFIENNGNGFTPGHFCYRIDENTFISSQRKVNHNEVFTNGMSRVDVSNDNFIVKGTHKASVGARSQWLLLKAYPDYDCIIHTHNPLKNAGLPIAQQRPFQCGSLECGLNTLNNLGDFNGIKAVYLDKHGANILFKSTDTFENIKAFIDYYILLGEKVS